MKKRDYEIAQELKERLSKFIEIIDFRVFGSRARGDASDDSDMDVFLEVPSLDKELKERILDIAWEVSLKNLTVVTMLIYTKEEIENSPLRISSIIENVIAEGVKV